MKLGNNKFSFLKKWSGRLWDAAADGAMWDVSASRGTEALLPVQLRVAVLPGRQQAKAWLLGFLSLTCKIWLKIMAANSDRSQP